MLSIFTEQKYENIIMIAKFFNKTKPINTLIALVFLAIIFLISFFYSTSTTINIDTVLKRLALLGVFLIILFLINFIVRKNQLTKNNAYVLLLMVLFVGMFPLVLTSAKLLATNLILLLAYRRIYSLRSQKSTKEKLFDSTFWIGIATLIYPWSFLYMVLVFATVIVFKKWTLRHAIIPLVGFITPVFLYFTYLLAFNKLDNFDLSWEPGFNFYNYNSLKLLIPIALILAFLIWTVFPTTVKIMTVNNKFRLYWMVVLFHLTISLFIVIFAPVKNGSEFLFLMFPMAIAFTNYLQRVKEKWFREVFLYLFLAITITIYIL